MRGITKYCDFSHFTFVRATKTLQNLLQKLQNNVTFVDIQNVDMQKKKKRSGNFA